MHYYFCYSAQDQRMVQPQQPDYLLTLKVTSRPPPVMERVTENQIILSCAKTRPKIGQHTGTWGTYPRTLIYARGLQRWSRGDQPTNGDLLPDKQYLPYGACQLWDHPGQYPPRQWRFAATQHPNILSALTPGIHLGRSRRASATPPRWHRLPNENGRPPRGPSQGRLKCDLWCTRIGCTKVL